MWVFADIGNVFTPRNSYIYATQFMNFMHLASAVSASKKNVGMNESHHAKQGTSTETNDVSISRPIQFHFFSRGTMRNNETFFN